MSTSTPTSDRAITLGKMSADAHVNEPRTLWADNLPVRMRDHAMRGIAAGDDGGWSLILDGRHVAKAFFDPTDLAQACASRMSPDRAAKDGPTGAQTEATRRVAPLAWRGEPGGSGAHRR
jgi:hypothetical protein